MSMNKPAINSEWTGWDGLYKVVGFKVIHTGQTGVELVRFIKTRKAWAKTPVCFSYLDEVTDTKEYGTSPQFFTIFTASGEHS
jgi:hypothetical protein